MTEHSTGDGSRFRPDIEGLRAVAVALVLLYHAGVRQLRGGFVGVDVFFVISGFLITGLLVRELESSGSVSLARFYARRAKRLLPATAVVLVATTVLAWRFLSITDWGTFGGDVVAAAIYLLNWRLAARSVDYLAEGVGPSPVRHFWSLAVEEQFYLVWPALLVAVAWWVRRWGGNVRSRTAVGLAVVAVPSFGWSVYLTAHDPASAYFVSTTRLWELAIGAAVAVGTPRWAKLGRTSAMALGGLGLAAIFLSGVVFREGARWPGYSALLPTLGTAAVIVAGCATRDGVARLLSLRPMVWIGGLSYSLYLWHWPLLVAAMAHWNHLGVGRGLLVVAASVVPAWLSQRLVENPLRFSKAIDRSPLVALSLGLNFSLIGAVAGLGLALAVPPPEVVRPDSVKGAAALARPAKPAKSSPKSAASAAPVTIVPDPIRAAADVPAAYSDDCQVGIPDDTPIECTAGDPNGTLDMVLAGDSKMMQWYSAFDELGKANGWKIRTLTKSICAFAAGVDAQGGHPYLACLRWNEKAMKALLAHPPDVLVTSQRQPRAYANPADESSPRSKEAMSAALVKQWAKLENRGIEVIVLLDNPGPEKNAYECVAKNRKRVDACAFPRGTAIERSAAPTQLSAAAALPSVSVIDLTPSICPNDPCAPVIGGVLVYRQGSHLTDTYVRTLVPQLQAALEPLVKKRTK
jgi:peptidoglycan/LPS O-acetylase OafA/YrhL